MNATRTLIIGGTGKTGRRVAQRLKLRGVPVTIASRTGEPAFDWNEPRGWAAVLNGFRAVYLAYYPDVAAPEAAERLGELSRLAVRSGVRRIVLLSGRGEPTSLPGERAVSECGTAFTILRSAFSARTSVRSVRYVPVTAAAYRAALAEHLPANEADFWTALFGRLFDGHNSQVSTGVEEALGRKPRDFSTYVRDAAAAGAWDR